MLINRPSVLSVAVKGNESLCSLCICAAYSAAKGHLLND